MRKDKIVLYMHAGSGNHGCEALANTICKMLDRPIILVTNNQEEDLQYSLNGLCELRGEKNINQNFFVHLTYYIWRRLMKDPESFVRYRFASIRNQNAYALNISIGGDNYCYDTMIKDLILTNKMLHHQGSRTVLFGCSIEPELLEKEYIRDDMLRYDAIFARESITYHALMQAGISAQNLFLYPDPAFTLLSDIKSLPNDFIKGNTIGINISPMIMENETVHGVTMENYKALLQHILDTTDMNISLIPHVVWERNDDRKPLNQLYRSFVETNRVVMLEDKSCTELKGIIGRCRMFIGARTHATIAAYSSYVPTLVVGYSVKAKGIAKDLFGTYEHYVLPVQQLSQKEDLIQAFEWLKSNEDEMRYELQQVMPGYIEKARMAGEKIKELEKEWGI